MGFTAPAIHYSSLSTLPLDLSSAKTSHSTTIQSKIHHLLTKFLNNDISNGQILDTTQEKKSIETNPSSTIINNNSEHQIPTSTSFERLPFTEPYVSKTPKIEKRSFEFSSYHQHCTTRSQKPSSILTNREIPSKSPSRKTPTDDNDTLKLSKKKNDSLTSLEKSIAYKYATEKKTSSIRQNLRSSSCISKQQQQQQHQSQSNTYLRRLQSKSKIHPIPTEFKPSISTSIAQRIELLKNSMHNHQFDSSPIPSTSSSAQFLSKQTQTNDLPLKSSELHHIHHHHIHSSSYSSFSCRFYSILLGSFLIFFLFLIEFITLKF